MNAAPGLAGNRNLDEQREEFARNPFIAMPVAGAIAWTITGLAGVFLPFAQAVLTLFVSTASIFGIGLLVAHVLGEDLLGRTRPGNVFDSLFLHVTAMTWLVFAIAIPFFQADPTSLPLSIGILAGLVWIPLAWIIRHWIGWFHAIVRTLLVLLAWHLFPEQRFVAVPAVIVAVYLISIVVLARRGENLPLQ